MPRSPESARLSTPRLLLALLTMLGFALAAPLLAQTGPLEDLDSFPHGKLEIGVGKKPLSFDIWVADTPARMSQGLMFVRSLPAQRGMLFVHESPKPVSMWMKNTYIPLDMVFIDAKGRIQQIVAQTTPHSLDIIRSKDPALAVLEIGGGEAQRLGIKPGQHVSHPAFAKR
jgi:uncharacterized membrane protein (UPF0127 family)